MFRVPSWLMLYGKGGGRGCRVGVDGMGVDMKMVEKLG